MAECLTKSEVAASVREILLEETALPPPMNLAGVPLYPLELPPSLGEAFVGRADHPWQIHSTLSTKRGEPSANAALAAVLEGGGGFGKTRLALEYLHRFGPCSYPGGLFWVNADVTGDQLESQFHGILRILKPEIIDLIHFRDSRRDAGKELASALQALPADRPALLVVDNVPETKPGEAPKPLRTFCPALGIVTLLVTSRMKVVYTGQALQSLAIDILMPDAAVRLLTYGVERTALHNAS
jgi:hypothetical protein